MIEKKCKYCTHRIVRHDVIRDRKGKMIGAYCLDCRCNTLKKISEFDRNRMIATSSSNEDKGRFS